MMTALGHASIDDDALPSRNRSRKARGDDEIYKEHERVYYNLPRDRRYGYNRILGTYERQGVYPLGIKYHDGTSLAETIEYAERDNRMRKYWEKKRSGERKDRE